MSKPRCPECGGPLGVLVAYTTTRIHVLEASQRHNEWQPGAAVLRAAHPIEQSESADTPVVCLACHWTGPNACQFDPRPRPT